MTDDPTNVEDLDDYIDLDMNRIANFATELERCIDAQPQWVVIGAVGLLFGESFDTKAEADAALDTAKAFTDLDACGVDVSYKALH